MAKRFFGSMMHKAGHDPARVIACRVVGVNLVNYTVDVVAQFDRVYCKDIQVGSPYLHYNQGEGIFVIPDIGAVCMVTMPSDTSPPFVSSFLAPMEVKGDTSKPLENPDDAIVTTIFGDQTADTTAVTPEGAEPSRGGPVPYPEQDASFAAGRPMGKPGDIVMRGRDGNFVILHRGGVLQVGATELAQRICIPLANKILDISGTYEHMNTGGAVQWGLQEGPSVDNPPTQCMSTYRVYANDKYCDIRVARGKVYAPVGEPDGAAGARDDLETYQVGTKEEIVYEIDLAVGGFKAGSGDVADAGVRNRTKFRFFFDRGGNILLRSEGAAVFHVKREIKVKAKRLDLETEEGINLVAKKGLRLEGGPLTEVVGDVVRVGAGSSPVARLGDQVTIPLGLPITGVLNGSPFTGTVSALVTGAITSGNPNFLG